MTSSLDAFQALGLPAFILSALTDVGYETPSPIQAACIPHLLAGRDLLGEAQTGTGKTAAFALPILSRIDLKLKKPQALILAPTRELAIQVAEAFQTYAKHLPGFHVLPVYGGQSMVVQLRALSRGAHVIVGTPGRIMDHLERKSMSLDALQTLVLDEADEMLRMGFIDDVEWILEHIPSSRQTALFSATMPEPIRRIAQRYLSEPEHIKIRSATATVAAIHQRYWQVRGTDKLEALTRILEVEENFEAAIAFVRTKIATVELAEKLEARGYQAAALNGDMTQALREQVIERLKSGSLDIVVATDVAARGLDVPRISHVINYDVPYDTEAYIHRIGRTGRAGRSGQAILFISSREIRMLKAIERATRQPIEPIALPTSKEVAERRVLQFKQQILDVLAEENLDFFYNIIKRIETEDGLDTRQIAVALAFMAQRERPLQPFFKDVMPEAPAFRERPARAERTNKPDYPGKQVKTERTLRDMDFQPESTERPMPSRANTRSSSAGLAVYRIEVGHDHGATPKEIVGAIANEGGIEGRLIGQIRLFDAYSTVELPSQLPKATLETLKRTRVRHVPINISVTDAQPEQAVRTKRSSKAKTSAPFGDKGSGAKPSRGHKAPRDDGKATFKKRRPKTDA